MSDSSWPEILAVGTAGMVLRTLEPAALAACSSLPTWSWHESHQEGKFLASLRGCHREGAL